jgi:hypothetical protein
MYELEQSRPYPETFLYLRTRLAVEFSASILRSLHVALRPFAPPRPDEDRVELLLPFYEDGTWENGFVLGLYTSARPSELANVLKPALDEYDAWQIRNTRGEWAEWIGKGPLSAYYKDKQESIPTAQIFLGFGDPEDMSEEAVAGVRAVYGDDRCLPVLHFRDGRILLLKTEQSARLIQNRLRSALSRIDYACGCDAAGEPFSDDDTPIWKAVSLEWLEFGAKDDDEL